MLLKGRSSKHVTRKTYRGDLKECVNLEIHLESVDSVSGCDISVKLRSTVKRVALIFFEEPSRLKIMVGPFGR